MRGAFWQHFDFWLLGAVIMANAFGIAMIRSAIAGNEILAGIGEPSNHLCGDWAGGHFYPYPSSTTIIGER